ncbi:MAG: hypothetical protein WCD21_41645 [Streptomyces sp.]
MAADSRSTDTGLQLPVVSTMATVPGVQRERARAEAGLARLVQRAKHPPGGAPLIRQWPCLV